MNSEILTAGPRGRQLCLALACALDDEFAGAARQRAFVLDDGSTMHRFVSVAVAGEPQPTQAEIDAYLAAEAARPVPTVADVAWLLEQVALPAAPPEAWEMATALDTSVAHAMYWQPPAGEDVLAGRSELDRGLTRIAEWAEPAVPDWWSAPMAPEQWTIGWWGHDPREPTRSATEWRKEALAEERRSRGRSGSGTWWSFPDGVASTRAIDGIPAGLDFTEDAGDTDAVQASAVEVPAAARVLEIDDPQVWVELCRAYPLEVTASRRHDWYRVTGRDGHWVIPDWAAVAEQYDAVHLTTAAYLAGATRAIDTDAETASMIAGWGPDVTQWLMPVQVGPPGAWGYDQDTDTWAPR